MGELHEEGDREVGEGGVAVGLLGASEVEEGTGELAGSRGIESEAPGGVHGTVVFARQGLNDAVADVWVLGHEVKEVGAGDGFDDAGTKRFCSNAVESLLEQGGEAEEVAGGGDAEEEKAPFAGGGSDFDAAAADDE